MPHVCTIANTSSLLHPLSLQPCKVKCARCRVPSQGTPAGARSGARDAGGAGAARRRREWRLRAALRHEEQTVAMVCAAPLHKWRRVVRRSTKADDGEDRDAHGHPPGAWAAGCARAACPRSQEGLHSLVVPPVAAHDGFHSCPGQLRRRRKRRKRERKKQKAGEGPGVTKSSSRNTLRCFLAVIKSLKTGRVSFMMLQEKEKMVKLVCFDCCHRHPSPLRSAVACLQSAELGAVGLRVFRVAKPGR